MKLLKTVMGIAIIIILLALSYLMAAKDANEAVSDPDNHMLLK